VHSQQFIDQESKIGFYVKTSYTIPLKESFSQNYNQYFIFGNAKIPLSIGVGSKFKVHPSYYITLGLERRVSKLESNDKISLSEMPILLGLKYYFPPSSIYLRGGIDYTFAIFKIKEFPETLGTSGEVIGYPDKTKLYSGFGLFGGAGFSLEFFQNIINSIEFSVNYNSLGDEKHGGLGNTGGINLSLYFIF
jgi:hypothetical protein